MGAWALAIDHDSIECCADEQRAEIEENVRPVFDSLHIPCHVLQERGHPVDRILHVAKEEKVDLIVLGSRGLRGIKELVLGSVSAGVLHHAACPVLIVRGDDMPQGLGAFQNIMLASDGSDCARNAAEVAVNLAHGFGTNLSVVNVRADISAVSVPGDDFAPMLPVNADAYAHQLLEQVKRTVSNIAVQSEVRCSYHQEVGHPDETIVRFATDHHADLLVLGSRGEGGFERMLVGSVSNYVAHHANCPVLIVR